jgi:cell division protein FtsL
MAQNNAQVLPQYQPQPNKQPDLFVMPDQSGQMSKARWTQKEMGLSFVCVFVVACLLVGIVTCSVLVNNANRSLAAVTTRAEKISSDNSNLKQEINELSSHGRLQKVANKYGLSLENQSIRNVSK